ncbi:MAG: formimidoylglutamase [Gammaproteobacteria bacterium]|nr:formimidoylglutamase [Gammaproteobacteria bacterium]MDH5692742.1 formimidoylglutamase [Gammaproteobacteria bacterium]
MYQEADMTLWQGRVDKEDTPALRWHQVIQAWDTASALNESPILLGFRCDQGVKRNGGRVGAKEGPIVIRKALSNLAYHTDITPFDAGDIVCEKGELESAQEEYAELVYKIIQANGHLIGLGGGHEIAWGSFLGLTKSLGPDLQTKKIGIINFDAHFDLRKPKPLGNSGTPFRQIAEWCEQESLPFNYFVLGVNQSANTTALYDFANKHGVQWIEDKDCSVTRFEQISNQLKQFLSKIDILYFTICMDVFPAGHAPGVSAPASLGVEPALIFKLLDVLRAQCKELGVQWTHTDIAETNPGVDRDNQTAKLAARLAHVLSHPN